MNTLSRDRAVAQSLVVVIVALTAACIRPADVADLPVASIVFGDAGTIDCTRVAEVAHPAELDAPWSPSKASGYGMLFQERDSAGLVVREVIVRPRGTASSGSWSRREVSPQMHVNVVGEDGALCGTAHDDAGHPQLRIVLEDGGVVEPPSRGNCLAYANGWWATWENGNVVRGRTDWSESLGNGDAGVIPGVLPPGVVPWVQAISDDGEVAISVNYRRPGSWLLPSGVELKAPLDGGFGWVTGFTKRGAYGFSGSAWPTRWSWSGVPERLDVGDVGAFVQLVSIQGHRDGHLCGAIELAGAAFDTIAWWKADGGYVAPGILRAHGLDIDPVYCVPVGDDWYYVVHYPDAKADGGLNPRSEFIRLQLDCLVRD